MKARVWIKYLHFTRALLMFLSAVSCTHIPGFASMRRAPVGEGVVMRTETAHCLNLMPENAYHRIVGCETPSSYTVQAPGQRAMVFAKAKFRQLVRTQILRTLKASAFPLRDLEQSEVEIWLSAPVFEPERLQWVLAVTGVEYNFALQLPFNPEDWSNYRAAALLLGQRRYPSQQSWQAGVLLLEAKSFVSRQATLAYLAQFAPRQLDTQLWPLLKMHIRDFSERDTLSLLLKTPATHDYIIRVGPIPAGEAEAYRGLLYRFAWRE